MGLKDKYVQRFIAETDFSKLENVDYQTLASATVEEEILQSLKVRCGNFSLFFTPLPLSCEGKYHTR